MIFFPYIKTITMSTYKITGLELDGTAKSAFLNKVFSLFGLSIFATGFGVYLGFNYFLLSFIHNPLYMFGVFAAELILIFTSRAWSKREPLNYFLFSLFTVLSGITLVPLLATFAIEFKGYDIIYRALFATTATFLAMAMIGFTSKRSFAGLGGFLMMGLIGMIIVGVLGIFIPWSNTSEMFYSGFGVIVFSGYALFDFNRLKHYPEDAYISAAIQLYLDIFNLFISILRLTGAISRK